MLLKHIFSDDLGNRLPEILSLLKNLSDKQSGLEYLETILKYLASGTDRVGAEEFKSVGIGSLQQFKEIMDRLMG